MSNNAIIPTSASKAKEVRELFGRIAPRYDLLNHLLSANIDKRWRRFTVAELGDVLSRRGARALDVCCGTADLALELGEKLPTIGIDFCHSMLVIGNAKVAKQTRPVILLEGDALGLPFEDESFDAVTCA